MNIWITKQVSLSSAELFFSASRSSGPGGQHVNKVNSRVTLRFHIPSSPNLTTPQKQRILSRLHTRITQDGTLHLHAQRHRSQAANRDELVQRLTELLAGALQVKKPRVPSSVPGPVKAGRLRDKKFRGRLKQRRTTRIHVEE